MFAKLPMVIFLASSGSTSCSWSGLKATPCDLFQHDHLCSLDPISNILGAMSGLESEVICQEQCALESNYNFFMFVTFTSRESECFLLTECNSANSTTCADSPDCSLAISGPKAPSLQDACCDQFQEVTCGRDSKIDHFYEVDEASVCQSFCRDTKGYRYWSLYVCASASSTLSAQILYPALPSVQAVPFSQTSPCVRAKTSLKHLLWVDKLFLKVPPALWS